MASRKLVVEILGDSRSLERAFLRSTRASKSFGESMNRSARALRVGFTTAGVAAAAGVAAFTVGAAKAVKASSALNEQINKSNVVFANNAREIQAWSETTANAFGLSQRQALESASAFGLMFQSAGFTEKASADMSKRLVELAADMGSFNDIDPTEMLQKLQSGLAGEAEPLRRFGVFITEAAIKQQAYQDGIAKTGEELTEAQKVQARYNFILAKTAKAQGDFARTSDSMANASRRIRALVEDIQSDLGSAFLPIVAKSADAIADFIDRVRRARGTRAKISIVVEGIQDLGRRLFDSIATAIRTINWDALAREIGQGLLDALQKLRQLAGQIDWEQIGRDASRRIVDGLEALIDFIEDIDWRLVGERIGKFLRAIDWVAIIKGVGRLLLASARALRDIVDEMGQQIAEGLGNAIGAGLDKLKTFLVRKMLELVNKILGATAFLGRLDPFKGTREKVQERLRQMERDTWDSAGRMNEALASIKDQSVDLKISIRTDIPGMEGTPTFGIAPIDAAVKDAAAKVDAAAKGAKDTVEKSADTVASASKDATTAAERRQKAFDVLMDAFDLKLETATSRGAMKRALAILAEQEAAIRKMIRIEGKTVDLSRRLLAIEQQRKQINEDMKEAIADAQQAAQFRALGLTATGGEPPPTIKNLRAQFESLSKNLTGTLADTAKNRARLRRIGTVLSDGFQKLFGKLKVDTREQIRDWFEEMRDAMREGGESLAPVARRAVNTNAILGGLGLSPDEIRKLRGRLTSVTTAGSTISPQQRTQAFGMIVPGGGGVTVENTIYLDGAVIGRSTKRFLQNDTIHSPRQKRGPNAGR